MSKAQPEFQLQATLSNYISIQYPNVLFLSDTVASLKLTVPQSVRILKFKKKALKRLFLCYKLKYNFKKNMKTSKINSIFTKQNRTMRQHDTVSNKHNKAILS